MEASGPSGISDTVCQEGEIRSIKIECPALCKRDVVVDLICNGCVVTISTQAPDFHEAASWAKQFQFPLSEGIFDYVEDHAVLDQDVLQLAFRARPLQNRTLRFQQGLAATSATHEDTPAAEVEEAAEPTQTLQAEQGGEQE